MAADPDAAAIRSSRREDGMRTERERRRYSKCTVVAALVVAAVGSQAASGARSAGAPVCEPAALHLAVSDQGTSGSTFIGLVARARVRCTLAGSAQVTILQRGGRASIKGNPLTIAVRGVLAPGKSRLVAHGWWIGWCKSRKALSIVVRYRTLSVRAAPKYVPRCDSAATPPRLVPAR